MILRARRHCIIIKKDIKDAFHNIPVATHVQWLLEFSWGQETYQEACLSFGLATSPFIFNLFAEAIRWILHSYLGWTDLEHYLDDFIRVLAAISPVLRHSGELVVWPRCWIVAESR